VVFQEPTDPFIDKLQYFIDDLKKNIDYQEFDKTLKIIDEKFPFVNLLEFLDKFIEGEYSKNLVTKFHLAGYSDYYKLLSILQLNKKRLYNKSAISRKMNLTDKDLSDRYYSLYDLFSKFQNLIIDRISYNTLRAVIIFYLFSNMESFSNKKQIIESLSQTINDFERLIYASHTPLSSLDLQTIESFVDSIILELQNNYSLEVDSSGNFRLAKHYLHLSNYIFNILQNRIKGITYQDLIIVLREKLPLLSQIPLTLIEITVHDLIADRKIIKKDGYWKFKPFSDLYLTLDNFRNFGTENLYESHVKNRTFFGRSILPDEFINEIIQLRKGDFADEDDQVTRIAGMILPSTNMLNWPPAELDGFDFSVDLTSYQFTREQKQLIKELDFQIVSPTIHVKVMIDEEITLNYVNKLIVQLEKRNKNEQGVIISFTSISDSVTELLQQNKIIQIVSKSALRKWCKITPVIASRKGAIVVIRQGDYQGNIAKIKSINYESGLTNIVLFPQMKNATQYIGSLEEIDLHANTAKFAEYSDIYFQFLEKLYQISDPDLFNKIITKHANQLEVVNMKRQIDFIPNVSLECAFNDDHTSKVSFTDQLDLNSLNYTTEDLFFCDCSHWNKNSRNNGLCEHLIFTLNETIKYILSPKSNLWNSNVSYHLKLIEQKIELFLKRLRYSNIDNQNAECPNCGQTAYTISGVEDTFGYRQMDNNNKFSLRRQSYCKRCR